MCAGIVLATSCAAADVERGRYLAEEVAQCQQCHTPRLETGEFDKSKWMKGATLNIQPIQPIKDWHKSAPDITPNGRLWNTWKEEGLLKYLETGLTPRGRYAGPPMPAYKLPKQDAQAIVDYLKTLETKE
jgi:mono/diheme cytochrome c family protein